MLKTGKVDGVVVAGCSLLLNPVLSVMLQKMDYVSPEGVSKPFDASGKWYAFWVLLSTNRAIHPLSGKFRKRRFGRRRLLFANIAIKRINDRPSRDYVNNVPYAELVLTTI